MPSYKLDCILPDWPVADSVVACCTTRAGGVSLGGFDSLNLATHVEDQAEHVITNRQRLQQHLQLPTEPQWLEQTHSTRVIDLDRQNSRQGDAAVTSTVGKVAVVLTADCLPILFCNQQGSEVAAAHAGWRGLLNGVLEQTLSQMKSEAGQVMAWMGPAISPQQFEVGAEVRQQFMQLDAQTEHCFRQTSTGFYLADLYALARLRLKKRGVVSIYGGEFCTFTESDRFFSYRREKTTGRQASLIYIKNNAQLLLK